jgi:U4/U6.U5 tri-snRNP-associated protein 3
VPREEPKSTPTPSAPSRKPESEPANATEEDKPMSKSKMKKLEKVKKAESRKSELKNGDAMDEDEDVTEQDLDAAMLKVMGFRNFKTTQNTKVPGNDKLFGVRKEKKTEYRQYMNRVGGFNRPLSPS